MGGRAGVKTERNDCEIGSAGRDVFRGKMYSGREENTRMWGR